MDTQDVMKERWDVHDSEGAENLAARKKRRLVRTTHSRHAQPVAPNILERNFSPGQPNSTWAPDSTTCGPGRDGSPGRGVGPLLSPAGGLRLGELIDRHLVLRALDMTLHGRQPPRGLLHHSGRGSQYASSDYQQALAAHGIQCSMSLKGNCSPVDFELAALPQKLAA